MNKLFNYEIWDEKQKAAFANVCEWQNKFRRLRCAEHQTTPRLNLSTGKKGSSVSIDACCDDFFQRIVKEKAFGATNRHA